MAVLGLRFCMRAFPSCAKWGPLFIAVRGPLIIAASLVAEHRLQTRRLSSCGSRAQLLRGMRDLPRPGLEPVSPALAGRLSTTAPPGKPQGLFLSKHFRCFPPFGPSVPLLAPPGPVSPLHSVVWAGIFCCSLPITLHSPCLFCAQRVTCTDGFCGFPHFSVSSGFQPAGERRLVEECGPEIVLLHPVSSLQGHCRLTLPLS